MTDSFTTRPLKIARRTAALALVAGATAVAANAQQAPTAVGPQAPVSLAAMLNKPLDLSAGVNYSSSTADTATTVDASAASTLDLSGVPADELQPPPRRRYGRPRYNDSNHNPDGSNKYAFIAGAGLAAPTNDFSTYTNLSYGFQVGVGRNFNKKFALMVQFDYDNFGFKGATLQNQENLYNYEIAIYNSQNPSNQVAPLTSLDGSSHVWSFTLDPVYTIYSGEGLGAYVVGGVGFFHKTANFTTPATGYYEDYFGNVYAYQANQSIDQYTSNAPGFNGGFGLTYKPSRFANERLYAEVRYNYMINSLRSGITLANVNTAPASTNFNDQYPANSHHTAWIPVKVGIRF
jgi:hypothetical protein